jgi:hypothetical protein
MTQARQPDEQLGRGLKSRTDFERSPRAAGWMGCQFVPGFQAQPGNHNPGCIRPGSQRHREPVRKPADKLSWVREAEQRVEEMREKLFPEQLKSLE